MSTTCVILQYACLDTTCHITKLKLKLFTVVKAHSWLCTQVQFCVPLSLRSLSFYCTNLRISLCVGHNRNSSSWSHEKQSSKKQPHQYSTYSVAELVQLGLSQISIYKCITEDIVIITTNVMTICDISQE